ncbi:hypothetical protein BGZ93_006559 [Podila epicladia]|nr:hypothetical protein BGZ93_006559 [Podila epicladia]
MRQNCCHYDYCKKGPSGSRPDQGMANDVDKSNQDEEDIDDESLNQAVNVDNDVSDSDDDDDYLNAEEQAINVVIHKVKEKRDSKDNK